MSQEFHAIYEHGVLKPLVPLNLPESAEVTGYVRQANSAKVSERKDSVLGLMSDEPELVDEILDEAMNSRESQPFRANG